MADADVPRVVSATREIAASAERIFELIADPSQQPLWDGNDNLVKAEPGQRIQSVGEVFRMALTNDSIRENHVSTSLKPIASRGIHPRWANRRRVICGAGSLSRWATAAPGLPTPTTGRNYPIRRGSRSPAL
jgi:hypothetical protein